MDDSREKIIYEYCILRYVPDIERGEFVNIGLLMMCKRHRWLKAELCIDTDRICAFFPDCEIKRLIQQAQLFERGDVPSKDLPVEEKYRWLAAVKSAIIQTSPSHPGILVSDETSKEKAEELLENKFNQLFSSLIR